MLQTLSHINFRLEFKLLSPFTFYFESHLLSFVLQFKWNESEDENEIKKKYKID